MPESLASIEVLPAQYGNLARSLRLGAAELARISAASLWNSLVPTNLVLRRASVETKLSILREANGLVFGFLRLHHEEEVLMEAAVSFSIEVSAGGPLPALLSPDAVLHRAVIPAFLFAVVSNTDQAAARKLLQCAEHEITFLQLDFGVLAVVHPEDFQSARVAWLRPRSSPWELAVNHWVPNSSIPRIWRIPPFLALARTVGLWARGGLESDEGRAASLPRTLDLAPEKASLFVLRNLTAAWVEAVNQVENRGAALAPGLAPRYEISDYVATVRLLVDAKGRLARKGASEDTLQLLATLHLEEDNLGVARSRIALAPPDFLVAGELYKAFLDALEQQDSARKLAGELGLKGATEAVRLYIRSARESEQAAPLVFRVKRGKRDTDCIIMHGTLDGLPQHVVVRGEFSVNAKGIVSVVPEVDSLEVLYTDRPRNGKPPEGRGGELILYFLRLLVLLKSWQEALR